MQPPSAQSQAFDATCCAWLGCWVDTLPLGLHRFLSDFRLLQLLRRPMRIRLTQPECTRSPQMLSCRLAVSDARVALPNFYNVTVRIANVAARLAVLGFWLGDKRGSPASP